MQKKTYSAPLSQPIQFHLEGAVSLLTGSGQKDPGFASGKSESLESHDESWDDLKEE